MGRNARYWYLEERPFSRYRSYFTVLYEGGLYQSGGYHEFHRCGGNHSTFV